MKSLYILIFVGYTHCSSLDEVSSVLSMQTKIERWRSFENYTQVLCSLSEKSTLSLLSALLPIIRQYGCAIYVSLDPSVSVRYALCDLDGTILQGELLAMVGGTTALADIIAREISDAMNGKIDFYSSLNHRTGLLRGVSISTLMNILNECPLAPGLRDMLSLWLEDGICYDLATGNYDIFACKVAQRLGFSTYTASEVEVDRGMLTGRLGCVVDAKAKAEFLICRLQALGLATQNALAIGDGANDLEMLSKAGHALLYSALPTNGQVLSLFWIYNQIRSFSNKEAWCWEDIVLK